MCLLRQGCCPAHTQPLYKSLLHPSCISLYHLHPLGMQFGSTFPKEKLTNRAKMKTSTGTEQLHIGEPRWSSFPQPGKGQERKNTRDVHKIIKDMENQLGGEWPLPLPVLKRGTVQIPGGKFAQIETPSLSPTKKHAVKSSGNLSPHVCTHLKVRYLLPYNFAPEFHLLKKNTLFHLHSKQVLQGKLKEEWQGEETSTVQKWGRAGSTNQHLPGSHSPGISNIPAGTQGMSGSCPVMLHGRQEESLSSSELPSPAYTFQCCQQATGPQRD